MADKHAAVARVRITVELDASSWGGDCPVDQVFQQASSSALNPLLVSAPRSTGASSLPLL